jgi:CsoR family transcriptional regulator, copper-sensing transcriptional repressor
MTDVADPHQDKLKVRLHRIEGQVRGIAKMIEEDRPAYDILMQLRAVRAALTSVSGVVATQYLNNQVSELVKSKRRSVQEQEVERLVSELQLFFKG